MNICASVDSTKLDAEPISAISHIQNTEPGPPATTAIAIPAIFPVPTRDAVDIQKAWNDETAPSFFSPFAPSPKSLNISPKNLNCTNFVLKVK